MLQVFAASALVATVALSPVVGLCAPAPSVATQQGVLLGLQGGDVTAFLGVPYAAPPVAANRWRSPQPAPAWSGVRDARAVGASCPQVRWEPEPPYTAEFDQRGQTNEDCLFLNIWTPRTTHGRSPVVVFIHGGGFSGGSGGMPLYNGSHLASNGVVVVTINYRLGIFGYLAHPDLSAEDPRHTSGDYGLEDQIAALKWVKANIAQFSGDPANVTIAGESAGAISVNSLIISPDAAGLFAKAVAFSGSGMGFPAPTLAQAEQRGVQLANRLGARTAAELRALPLERLLSADLDPPPGPDGGLRFSFWPVVDNRILPSDPEGRNSRPQSVVPLMTGFNADENSSVSVSTIADLRRQSAIWFGASADNILSLYPHATDTEAQASARLLARDRYMTSLLMWTDARAQASGQPIYRYLYDQPSPAWSGRSYGAFHTAGIPYVFGNLDRAARPYGPKDRAVSNQMQARLISFARDGRPGGTGLPAWPVAKPGDGMVMTLGLRPRRRMAVSTPARFEALRHFADAGGSLLIF